MRVLLDAGHGGQDPGALGPSGRKEKEDNFKAAILAKSLFESHGIVAELTRKGKAYMSLIERCSIEQKGNYD